MNIRFQSLLLIPAIFIIFLVVRVNANKNSDFPDASNLAYRQAGAEAKTLKDSVANVVLSAENPLFFSSSMEKDLSVGQADKIENFCAVSILAKAGLAKYFDQSQNTFEFNIKNILPIASLSKLMASVVAAGKINNDKEIKISENSVNTEGIAGEFTAGEVFRAKDLIKAMLMVSSNDAAVALAESIGEKKFIEAMNDKVKELGMADSRFIEPSGLSYLNQSTASDLSKLAAYIYYHYPDFLEITAQKERKIFDLEKANVKRLVNINIFAGEPDFIGGKTGYLNDEIGRNLVAFFKKNDRVILTIVLGAPDAFEETKKLLTCF